jgi:hypothetical protein
LVQVDRGLVRGEDEMAELLVLGVSFAREINAASTRHAAASPGSAAPQRSNVRETAVAAARF